MTLMKSFMNQAKIITSISHVNPRDIHIDFGEDENNEKDKVRWSGNSKDANLV